MLSDKVLAALNDQINAELGSAYQYLAMAAHFDAANLAGSAGWMRRQSREEVSHAMKIFDFVHDRDGRVSLAAVAQPQGQFASTPSSASPATRKTTRRRRCSSGSSPSRWKRRRRPRASSSRSG